MKVLIQITIVMLATVGWAQQDLDREIHGNRKQLEKVRDDINSLQKEITKTNIKTSSTLEQIKMLDREIVLLKKANDLLTKESDLLSKQITATREQLQYNRKKLLSLKDFYAKRVVHLYKYGKIRNLDLLVNSGSINQALIRYKYLKFFNDQEKNVFQKIKLNVEEIQNLEERLSADYQRQRLAIREKEQQQRKYLARKDDKKLFVNRLRWNNKNLGKRLKLAEEEYQKLYQLILALERQRQIRESRGGPTEKIALNLKNFNKNKGKLPWPVKGSVIHKYGKQYDSSLKTTINNTGIDIKASTGTQVHSVFTGLVSMITYLSGYGNTIIMDHGEGYYSVYSHLDEFFVDPDELVDAGHIIGLVGDSGSLEGSKLHFAIFSKQKTENPLNWLR